MKSPMKLLFIILFSISSSFAADLAALKTLFISNYDNFYRPRFCGQNIERLVIEANKLKIDLTNAYVMKIVGGGFLETSAFFSRNKINERVMIGYFHMVLVADGHVFDFDLDEPLVLTLEEYVRLQFTPPYEPYRIFGIEYKSKYEIKTLKITRFEWGQYIRGQEIPTWTKYMGDIIDIDQVMSKPRIR